MDNRIFFLMSKVENSMNVYIKQQLVKSGLRVTPAQLGILFMLKTRDRQTMTELSQALGTDNSAVTRSVDRLVETGLVMRNTGTADRREYHITITDAGIAQAEGAKKVIAAINKKIQGEFSTNELDDFKQTLVRMDSLFRG